MKYIFAIIGIGFAFLLMKYRESIGDSIGDQEWMKYVGGIYNLVVIIGVLIFFWSLATLTGTEDIFLAPIIWIFGGRQDIPADVSTLY